MLATPKLGTRGKRRNLKTKKTIIGSIVRDLLRVAGTFGEDSIIGIKRGNFVNIKTEHSIANFRDFIGSRYTPTGTHYMCPKNDHTYSDLMIVFGRFWQILTGLAGIKPGVIMARGSSLARLKKRAQKALEKSSRDRTYKEVKDISNWKAITERWEAMKGNQYATGLVRTEETLEKMRSSQRMRRQKELQERMRNAKCRVSSDD
jgi:hypothetical protein